VNQLEEHMNKIIDSQANIIPFSRTATPPAKVIDSPVKSPTHHAKTLSFMQLRKKRGTGVDYWIVESSGNYTIDCDKGEQLADEYLTYIGKYPTVGNATLLNCIVHDMIDRAKAGAPWTGVHVGFLSGINRYAMATAKHIENA
jgi:hypothetical protein